MRVLEQLQTAPRARRILALRRGQALMARVHEAPPPETKRASLAIARTTDAGVFEGYASVFNVVDTGGDMVAPGAFTASLRKRGAAGVKMLWQHQAAEPLGVWTQIVEDVRGLKVTGQLDLSVARAREALSLMRSNAIDGLSIGFRTVRAVKDRQSGVRRLFAVDLWEISIVTFPMLLQARVSAVKRGRGAPALQKAAPSLDVVGARLSRLRADCASARFEQALRRLS